jgi:plastocyanin
VGWLTDCGGALVRRGRASCIRATASRPNADKPYMKARQFTGLLLALSFVGSMPAGEIRGVVIVKRKLTKRTATASFDSYARGPAVFPAADGRNPLAYERTHTVIYLEGEVLPAVTAVTKTMKQENRTFVPDLIVVPVGSSLAFPNLDPVFHNVFSLSKAKSFDLGNYSKGQTRTVRFTKPGIVLVNCRIHANMGAAIVVTPNGFYAAPDAEGRFSIAGVPAGEYSVAAWHKSTGLLRKTITVTDETPATVDFFIPLEATSEPRIALDRR